MYLRASLSFGLVLLTALGITPPARASVTDNSVTTGKIVDGQVMTVDLANNAVTTAKIQDGQVANADLGANAVTTDKILDGTVGSADIGANSVNSAKIQDGQVLNVDLGANAVTSDKILDGAVSDAKILGVSASKVIGTVGNSDTVDGKHAIEFAPTVHAHGQSEVMGLAAALAGKSDSGHSHSAADITTGNLGVERLGT